MLTVLLWATPVAAFAAQLSIEPATLSLQAGETATISLTIKSKEDINTVGVGVPFSADLQYLRSEKGLVIEQWIDIPAYDASSKELILSGIIPGGWHGSARLATYTFLAHKAGTYTFAYDPTMTEVYKNDGLGTKDPIVFGTIGSTRYNNALLFGAVLLLLVVLVWLFQKKFRLRLI